MALTWEDFPVPGTTNFETNARSALSNWQDNAQSVESEVNAGRGGYSSLSARIEAISSGTIGYAIETWNAIAYAEDGYIIGNREGIFIDTTLGSMTVYLPTSPTEGTFVYLADYAGTFNTNNLILDPGVLNIRGVNDTLVCDVDWMYLRMTYVDATIGWIF